MHTVLRIGGMLGVLVVVAASLILTNDRAASAATATPGVPSAPVVVYSEDFENGPDTGSPQLLTDYSSASPQYLGGTYTAAPFWVSSSKCNGFIVSSTNSYPAGACNNSSGTFSNLQAMAPILGAIGGTDPATNSIVAAYTAGNPGTNNQIQFATVSPITLGCSSTSTTPAAQTPLSAASSIRATRSTHAPRPLARSTADITRRADPSSRRVTRSAS